MLENAFIDMSKKTMVLVGFGLLLIALGVIGFSNQLINGLTVTGMSRDVSWGFYLSQFTFLVGVAASAVMVVIPCYLHAHDAFKRTVILGEFLAVSAVVMCILFIIVDLGQPARVFNIFLYPQLSSPMFWDSVVLLGYLAINLIVGWVTLEAERKEVSPPRWIKPIIYLSIPWAVSIHTVTAYLFAGLGGRHLWLTAILAPRFLASAFASGPSLLIILALILRRYAAYDVGEASIRTLATIVTYAMMTHLFFTVCELFTVLFSGVPEFVRPIQYLFLGLDNKTGLVGWTWISEIAAIISAIALLFPKIRNNHGRLGLICAVVIASIWIDKGMGTVVAGFIPSPLESVVEYTPTSTEIFVSLGVYAIGLLLLTALTRTVVTVRRKLKGAAIA